MCDENHRHVFFLMEEMKQIDCFFTSVKHQGKRREESEQQVTKFLNSWKKDMILILEEVINLACCFAIHTKTENCAIYMGSIPCPLLDEKKEDVIRQIQRLQSTYPRLYDCPAGNNQKPYYTYLHHTDRIVTSPPGSSRLIAHIPVIISIRDIPAFLDYFKEVWDILLKETTFPCPGKPGKENEIVHKRNKDQRSTWLIRPERTGKAQARTSIIVKDKFSMRIDREEAPYQRLSLDIGSLKYRDALSNAQLLGEKSKGPGGEDKDIIFAYYDRNEEGSKGIVDVKGNITAEKNTEVIYPSLWASPLCEEKKAALFTALIATIGEHVGMRDEGTFSYHFREHIAKNKTYYTEFAPIMRTLSVFLSRPGKE